MSKSVCIAWVNSRTSTAGPRARWGRRPIEFHGVQRDQKIPAELAARGKADQLATGARADRRHAAAALDPEYHRRHGTVAREPRLPVISSSPAPAARTACRCRRTSLARCSTSPAADVLRSSSAKAAGRGASPSRSPAKRSASWVWARRTGTRAQVRGAEIRVIGTKRSTAPLPHIAKVYPPEATDEVLGRRVRAAAAPSTTETETS